MRTAAIFCFVFLFVAHAFAAKPERIAKELWSNYQKSEKGTAQEVHALGKLAVFYVDINADYQTADTLCERAIAIAKKTNDVALQLEAYEYYFFNQPSNVANPKAIEHADQLLATARKTKIRVHYVKAHLYRSEALYNSFLFTEAYESVKKAELLAKPLQNPTLEINILLQKGRCQEKLNNKKVALSYFLRALDIAERDQLTTENLAVLDALANMFHDNDNFDKALEYRQKKLQLLLEQKDIDSSQLLSLQYYFVEFGILPGQNKNPEPELDSLLKFTKTNGYLALNERYWALYRSYLIPKNGFEKLFTLYTDMYPEDLEEIKKKDVDLYLRLNAYFFEHKKNIDSANYCWQKVLQNIEAENGLYFKSHRYLRYTEFLLRNGRYKDASKYARAAFEVAKSAHYVEFQRDAMVLLEQIDLKNNDFQAAYAHSTIRQEIEINLLTTTRQEGLLVLELQHEVERRALIQKKEEEARKADMRAAKIKANAFGVGLVIFLLLSAIVLRQYQLTRKEKERSDELLLNILPEDTALELKNTGKTTARQYTNVTVLFCDIVGFTLVAEKLTPQELVKEIDTYFRAFDEVITKFGMEKIKTVGDAYVAVGGMPLKNKATATDVVNAAIELLQKVHALGLERRAANKPAFTLRVGLNTGSVVAGVVGSKKFQYDIWGDAVNIAARMEQTSEPGRINISEETYKVVKNDFTCTPRGDLEAKNKGLMAMYFVEFDVEADA